MATEDKTHKFDKWWVAIIGSGVALSPIHNQWLTSITTNADGETLFFLPAFGYLLIIMGSGLFLVNNWDRVVAVGLGSKKIVIPLIVIVIAIALSGITADGVSNMFAPLGAGLSLLALYMAARILGKDIFLPLAIGAGIASLGVILHAILRPGILTGGFIFEGNYDIVVGYVLLGAALFVHKWQWVLAGLALVALLLTGSPEGLFALGVLGIVVLARRDWGRKLAIIFAPVLIAIVAGITSGYGVTLYTYVAKIATGEPATPYAIEDSAINTIEYRIQVAVDAMSDIKPLGEGYNLTDFSKIPNVHNVPLVIVQQLGYPGILAAVCWLWVTIRCLVKTKWKYLFVLLLTLSIFDHFIWTQLAPLFWVAVGVSTAPNNIGSDLIFRNTKGVLRS